MRYQTSLTLFCALCLSAPATAQHPERVERKLEQITVTARGGADDSRSLLNQPLTPRTADVPVNTMADFLQAQPGLAYAGQGGLLQTISIRGISGQRVANFYGDLPVLSERRAGTSSSFIDPLMLSTVEIVRGPASVYYGSGAVAGVLQMQPARPEGIEAQLQWGSEGDENLQYLGYGNQDISLAFSRRSADNSKAANGTSLNTGFEQLNAQLTWDFSLAGKPMSFSTLLSDGEDIGKSNALYPDQRVTDYPGERHWIAHLEGDFSDALQASAWYHQQELETRVDRPGERINEVDNRARDGGFRLAYQGAAPLPYNLGLEYFGRRNVRSDETETHDDGTPPSSQDTLDAEQDTVDLYLDSASQFGAFEVEGGLRWSFLSQQAHGFGEETDDAPSLFLRGTWFSAQTMELSLELASGVRFPSLGERFFSGTTGRGQVIGNPGLDPEQTLSADLGTNVHAERWGLELHIYGMRIDDYIERVDIAADLRTFANLGEGDIVGAEAAWRFRLSDALTLQASGHYIQGEDQSGNTLSDIAPPQASAGLEYRKAGWDGSIDFQYRFQESDVAASEQPVGSARLLSASLGREWAKGWRVSVWGRNLLDETWRLSADAIAPLGARRSLGVSLSWHDGG